MEKLRNLPRLATVHLLRAYKWALSPMLPAACRYVPTCSEYAMEAVELHGVIGGVWRTVWRLLRCQPFAKGGFDPVDRPKERSGKAGVCVSHAQHN